jgi:hypothetical protein
VYSRSPGLQSPEGYRKYGTSRLKLDDWLVWAEEGMKMASENTSRLKLYDWLV